MNLNQARQKINKLDGQILSFLAQRQSLMPAIGRFKKSQKLAINQPAREREILAHLMVQAKKKKLDPDLIQKIFKLIFKNSKDIQKRS